ncbi:MAG: TM0106 family RecB-like putative nuclease [Thermoleophilia bacterium]|nr:TM0106 family RecB-like putative nuclease [Thermoleophilia bacterium]
MRLTDAGLRFSPSDLAGFAACEHLTQLEVAAALGELERPHYENDYGELLRRKGDEHERAYLRSLRDAGHEVVELDLGEDRDFEAAAARTAAAMRSGAAYLYQAVLVLDGWRGIADFLERIERPSELGSFSYEVLDTKLARTPKPAHALQLCFYSEAVARIQGVEPESAHVVLGTSERATIRLADVSAYHRRLRSRFSGAVGQRPATEPYPCDHCPRCDFGPVCKDWWRERDHLVRVAGIRRDQVERLCGAGIATRTALAESTPPLRIRKLPEQTADRLREQAAAQVESEREGRLVWRPRPVEEGRGFHLLPRPSPGDVVLDLEGHPVFEPARGLEFLFGLVLCDPEGPSYLPLRAHDRAAERAAFERAIDLVHERLERHPDLHLYHYGGYESGALKRLMGEHGTREGEVDDLLRRGVLVDLLTVTRQALVVGAESYSLKETEKLAGFVRRADIGGGGEAVVAFERWLETRDGALLAEIEAYNEEDCRATLALRDWLLTVRPELPWREPVARKEHAPETEEAIEARELLRLELVSGEEEGSPRRLAGELLGYHRRESKPAWWSWFERMAKSPEELVDEAEAIGCLEVVAGPEPHKRSQLWTLAYPEQEHKLEAGDEVDDPATDGSAGQLVALDEVGRTVCLVRGPSLAEVPLPRALVGGRPYRDHLQRAAVMRFAESLRDGTRRYPALEDVLRREPPRRAGRERGGAIQTIDPAAIAALARSLDGSYLFVQGPPGSGKTWRGAEIVVDLLARGFRVGVTAQSHKVIHNLLAAIEHEAARQGKRFRGLKKSGDDDETEYDGDWITNTTEIADVTDSDVGLVAGTAWVFSREELDSTLDYLVIDEAGQVSLADAIAVGTSARNLILLGDPLQLAQVSQGTHPGGSGRSVLEHLLAGEATIPADRGVFLEQSWRMHPDVCGLVSGLVYAGRLSSHETAAARSTSLGTGIRYLPVEHEGNASASPEEAGRIAAEIRAMLGATFTDEDGATRPLEARDFMVVAPYNRQVRELRRALPAGVPVGTVDRFQGQQAPVVFFSMATSSGEDAPRNLAFLCSRNRLNVAISRAQCLAVLVCSPRLLEARCATIEELELVNALCRLVEHAGER